jgi:uncharacterized protein (TIGR00299 family) protein
MAHGDDHGHDHDHDHAHTHAEGHTHQHEYSAPEPLERGAGAGKLLFFDCFSGVAGDMTIAALLDMGVPLAVINDALEPLPVDGYELAVGHAHRSSIVATKFDVHVTTSQPHRTYGSIDDMLAQAPLDDGVKTLARAIFLRLGEAEARAHRMPLRDVHFHEVGAVDAIVDVVGAAAGLSYLGADIAVSPLPMGRGFVKAQHGILPLPAPATIATLRGVPTYAVELDKELVTPTGAAIVASAAKSFTRWPSFAPELIGFGAGTMEFPDRPNMLRLVLGTPNEAVQSSTHVVLEANVDDMSGELAAHALSALLSAGALDAWAAPITMKKGRPALTIAALAERAQADAVADAMLRETTTIGVRRSDASRTVRPRKIVEVSTRFGKLPLKVSGGEHGAAQVKPEFDACVAAAKAHGVPVRVVLQEAIAAYSSASASGLDEPS